MVSESKGCAECSAGQAGAKRRASYNGLELSVRFKEEMDLILFAENVGNDRAESMDNLLVQVTDQVEDLGLERIRKGQGSMALDSQSEGAQGLCEGGNALQAKRKGAPLFIPSRCSALLQERLDTLSPCGVDDVCWAEMLMNHQ